MRAIGRVLCLIPILLAVAATVATPAQGADRLARAAAALERSPLFVHPDLLSLLPREERAQITRDLRRSPVPVRVAVLPVIAEDESEGDRERVLFGIQKRLDRAGVLVVVDQDGLFALHSFRVMRNLEIPVSLLFVDFQGQLLIGERLARLVDLVERAPRGPATSPEPSFVPSSGDDELDDSMRLWQVLLAGVLFGGALYAVLRFAAWFGGLVIKGFRVP